MKEKSSFLGSHAWKKFVNVAYNLGASVVIIGAMFKILHLPYGDLIIGIGMLSEAILFAITAIDPIGYDYHWEKVFPSLINGDTTQTSTSTIGQTTHTDTQYLSQKLDRMLTEAGIDARLMQNLADGMNRLSRHAQSLSSLGEASGASASYTSQINAATQNLETLNRIYGTQIEQMTHQAENIRTMTSSMGQVAQMSSRVSSEIHSLAENLSSLNSIYGSVLSAMNSRSPQK